MDRGGDSAWQPVAIQHGLGWRFSIKKVAFPLPNVEGSLMEAWGGDSAWARIYPKHSLHIYCICLMYFAYLLPMSNVLCRSRWGGDSAWRLWGCLWGGDSAWSHYPFETGGGESRRILPTFSPPRMDGSIFAAGYSRNTSAKAASNSLRKFFRP